jgi:hypothetical protein
MSKVPYQTRANIVAAEYQLFIAPRTEDRTPVALPAPSTLLDSTSAWKPMGAFEFKSLKFKTEPFSTTLQGGQPHKLGTKATLDVSLLQSIAADYTATADYENKICDILAVKIGANDYILYAGLSPFIKTEDSGTIETPNKIIVHAEAVVSLDTDVKSSGVLVEVLT